MRASSGFLTHGPTSFALLVLSGLGLSLMLTRRLTAIRTGICRPALARLLRALSAKLPVASHPASDARTVAAVELSSIELALLAELNLEMARAHEQVVEDSAQRLDTRRTAGALAAERRERARLLQKAAQTAAAAAPASSCDEKSTHERRSVYVGPERRTRARRRKEPRARAAGDRHVLASDRRAIPDRRRRERRQPHLRLC